jgi:hypothetical protein
MFKHHCTVCERTQLIFGSQVSAVEGTPEGVIATFTCWCGATQVSSSDFFNGLAAPKSPAVADLATV